MSLQVRVLDSLGDRLVDLEDRGPDQALVVGRADGADLQVPSMNVSRRHCLLFVSDGQWMIQDAGGGRGTYLNDQPLNEVSPIHCGDIVALGAQADPPKLLIDPYGVSHAQRAGAQAAAGEHDAAEPAAPAQVGFSPRAAARPVAPASPAPQFAAPPPIPTFGSSATLDRSFAMPVPAAPVSPAADDVADDDIEAPVDMDPPLELGSVAAAQEWNNAARKARRPAPPRQRGLSAGMLGAGVTLAVVIIAIGAYVIHEKMEPAPQVQTQLATAAHDGDSADDSSSGPARKSIFQFGQLAPAQATPKSQPAPGAAAIPSGPTVSSTPGAQASPGASPGAHGEMASKTEPSTPAAVTPSADPDFDDLQATHSDFKEKPALQVARYSDYKSNHPNAHQEQVNKFMDESLDRIWWNKINELLDRRRELRQEMAKKNADIHDETAPDFKKQLEDEKARLQEQIEQTDEQLKDIYHYDSNERVNVDDPEALTRLRQQRDPVGFGRWKGGEIHKITSSNGQSE